MTPPTDIETRPGEVIVVGQQDPQLIGGTVTLRDVNGTSPPTPVDMVKHLLSGRPLCRPNRTRPLEDIENEIDLAAIEEGKDDPGEPWEDVKDELGL